MSEYAIVAPEDFDQSVFRLIGKEWMLVTAKNQEGKVNTIGCLAGWFRCYVGKNIAVTVQDHKDIQKNSLISQNHLHYLSMMIHSRNLSYLEAYQEDEDKIAKHLTPNRCEWDSIFEKQNRTDL